MNGVRKYKGIHCCIPLVILFFCVSSVFAAQKRYQDTTIMFHYPEDWELSTEKNHHYEIKLRPEDWLAANQSSEINVDDFALYISVSGQMMEETAARHTPFIQEGTKWKIEGRHRAEGDVEAIKGKNWKGIVGETPVGRFYKGGGYFGLGWSSTVVISNGKTSVVLSGEELESPTGQSILKSIELVDQ